ncbi:MAG: helix-turn-helix transcriptional regulator [Candidatus Limivicinus sp.]
MNCIPVINMTATGKNIMRLRKNAGMTVKDLQNVFGFTTPQAIYKWQRGTAMPTLDNMVVLAAVFGVTIDEIIIFQNEPRFRVIA